MSLRPGQPHLVVWDYLSNDLLSEPGGLPYGTEPLAVDPRLHARVADRLARRHVLGLAVASLVSLITCVDTCGRLLSLPSRPAVLFLALLRGMPWQPPPHQYSPHQYAAQAAFFEPVATHYGMPMVSPAVRPAGALRTRDKSGGARSRSDLVTYNSSPGELPRRDLAERGAASGERVAAVGLRGHHPPEVVRILQTVRMQMACG